MARSQRTWVFVLMGQATMLVLVWLVLSIKPLEAQKDGPQLTVPGIQGRYRVEPSHPDGTSDTIGTLPAQRPGYSYLSVSSAAFHPVDNTHIFINYGKGIFRIGAPADQFQSYIAPLTLPPGSVVTNLVMIGGDTAPDVQGNRDGALALSVIESDLDRLDLAGNPPSERELAIALSYPNTPLTTDLGIYSANASLLTPVDPVNYAYFLKLDMPKNEMSFRSARIEYTMATTTFMPTLRDEP